MEELLSERNNDGGETTAEQIRNEVRLLSRGGKNEETGNAILEVSDRILQFWKVMGGVDLIWRTYRVRELSGVELCFRCFGHGHGIKSCREAAALCKRCGEAGHLVPDENDESCRNCRLAGKQNTHPTPARSTGAPLSA